MKFLAVPFFVIALSVMLFSCNSSLNKTSETKEVKNEKEYMVVAYVAGYRDFDFTTIDVSGITHINYAFGNIRNGEAVFDTTKIDGKNLSPDDIVKLNSLKAKNPDLKVLVSIGGWSWSKGFSNAAMTEASRAKFAESCARFVKEYKLDGIDLDWEYPNQIGGGNPHHPLDVHNFTLMLKEVRAELDKIGAADNKHYLLAIATGADKAYVDNTELGEIHKYIDFLNIMTYDFYNGWHHVNGHLANLYPSAHPELDMNSVVNAVDMHVNAGFPAKKINLGIPFYGRLWTGIEAEGDQFLFNKAGSNGMGIDYINFYRKIDNDGYKRYWDDNAKAPYLWNAEKKEFISYEDEESIVLKVKYLKQRGLAGAMFWEYSADHENKLLNALLSELHQ